MGSSIHRIVITLCFVFSTFSVNAKPLTFGVVPQQSAKKMAENWWPAGCLAASLSGLT